MGTFLSVANTAYFASFDFPFYRDIHVGTILLESKQNYSVLYVMNLIQFHGCSGAIGDCLQAIKLDDSRWQPHYCMG